MINRYSLYLLFVVIFLSLASFGQKPRLKFERVTNKSGRSFGFITGIIQDTTGFMWFSTRNGLYRYDGYSYREFRRDPQDSTSLPFNDITQMYYDSEGVLWLKHLDRFVAFSDNKVDTSYNFITSRQFNRYAKIIEDDRGNLWVGPGARGLLRFDRKTGELKTFHESQPLYRQKTYDYADSIQRHGKVLQSISKVGNRKDTTVTFTVSEKKSICVVGVGEIDQWGRYDYGSLKTLNDSVIWSMNIESSKHAGGGSSNRMQLDVLQLKPGTYTLHYNSDNSHAFGDWSEEKPTKCDLYGIALFEITEEEKTVVKNKIIEEYAPENSISSDKFRDMIIDEHGRLTIISKKGMDTYYASQEQFHKNKINFKKLLNLSSLDQLQIHCLFQDSRGVFWIGTSRGLIRFNRKQHTSKVFRNTRDNPDLLANNTIYDVYQDKSGMLWIGTNEGMSMMDLKSNTIYNYHSNIDNRLYDNSIYHIFQDEGGVMWVGTKAGLNRQKMSDFKFTQLQWNGFSSLPLYIDKNNNSFWYLKGSNKLYQYKRDENRYEKYPLDKSFFPYVLLTGSRDYGLNDMREDKNGNLWLAINDGLYCFNKKSKQVTDSVTISNVAVGTDSVENNISTVRFDRFNNIWIFGIDGVYKYKTQKDSISRFISFDREITDVYNVNEFVTGVLRHTNGNIWLRSVEGIYKLEPATEKIKKVYGFSEDIQATSLINGNLYEDKQKNIWGAFLPKIFKYKPDEETKKIYDNQNIGNVGECNIMRDSSGILWIYTDNGLFQFKENTEVLKQFSNRRDIAGNVINDVIDDGRDHIWITSAKGLTKFNKQKDEFSVMSHELEHNKFVTASAENFQESGELLFFTDEGFYSYYPDSINRHKPNVVVTRFQLFGDEIKFDSLIHQKREIVLSYNQNFFTFEFASLDYAGPSQNRFAYMLEGLDKNWTYTGANDRKAPYTSVPPGEYVFRLKGANNDGVWSDEETRIHITVVPPIWKRPWAYFIYVAVLIFGIFAVIKLRERQFKREKQVLERKVAERTAKIEHQKEELANQRDIATRQRDQIAEQKQSITDSIQYARRIQNALLPPENFIGQILPNHFILNRPRDIVSGDYYWVTQKGDNVFIVAADCTGHGVPGAFMSMLGVAFLNEIVNRKQVRYANDVLNELKDYVIKSLHQTGEDDEAKDGMDIAICMINKKTMKLEYAGAFNPLYLIRDNELIKIKGDRMPIGIYFRKQKYFTNHEIDLKKGDTFYIFSDGYVDQFGGEKGRKFMAKNFQRMLLNIQHLTMDEQKQYLENTLDEWMDGYQQIDDILVVGVRI